MGRIFLPYFYRAILTHPHVDPSREVRGVRWANRGLEQRNAPQAGCFNPRPPITTGECLLSQLID